MVGFGFGGETEPAAIVTEKATVTPKPAQKPGPAALTMPPLRRRDGPAVDLTGREIRLVDASETVVGGRGRGRRWSV